MNRIPLIERGHLDDDGRRLYDEILAARGSIAGPFRIWLHSPDFTSHATRLGEFLRYRTSLPRPLSEFVILLAAQATKCPAIRDIHVPLALEAGLPGETIAAIDAGEAPSRLSVEEAAVREFCMQLLRDRTADAAAVRHMVDLLGAKAAVEITGLCGYYTMVAMTLNAFEAC